MKNLMMIVVVLAVAVGGYMFMNKPKDVENRSMEKQSMEKKPEVVADLTTNTDQVKEVIVEAGEMWFSPNVIKVKKGDTVKITLKNTGEYTHDWVIDEFKASTAEVESGKTAEVTFVADQVGTFEYYCSIMEHRAKGMVGKLIVE